MPAKIYPKVNFVKRGRRWLNPISRFDSGGGAIIWRVSAVRYDLLKPHISRYAELNIRDCSRAVNLELPLDTLKGRKAAKIKLSVLINELTDMRNAVTDMP